MGKINHVGSISKKSLSVFNVLKYTAGAVTAKTVAWLVDWGIPNKFAINNAIATENRIIETKEKVIKSGDRISLPTVVAVPLPATIAPINTIIPNKPGIKPFLIMFAPYAAENEGAVPLPPIFIAKKIATRNGIKRWLNKGDTIILFKF